MDPVDASRGNENPVGKTSNLYICQARAGGSGSTGGKPPHPQPQPQLAGQTFGLSGDAVSIDNNVYVPGTSCQVDSAPQHGGLSGLEIAAACAWPVAAIVGISILAWAGVWKALSRVILNGFSLKYGDLEVRLTGADQLKFRAALNPIFSKLNNDAIDRLKELNKKHKVSELVAAFLQTDFALMNSEVNEPGAELRADLRATVYIPDILFSTHLVQAIDYVGPKGYGHGIGRRFSQRYGMIGVAWRLGHNMLENQLKNQDDELMEKWGMTSSEAMSPTRARKSCMCLLFGQKKDVGLLFIDATEENFFLHLQQLPGGPRGDVENQQKYAMGVLTASPSYQKLSDAVAGMVKDLKGIAPMVDTSMWES